MREVTRKFESMNHKTILTFISGRNWLRKHGDNNKKAIEFSNVALKPFETLVIEL